MCAWQEVGDSRTDAYENSKPQFDTQNELPDADFVPVRCVSVFALLTNSLVSRNNATIVEHLWLLCSQRPSKEGVQAYCCVIACIMGGCVTNTVFRATGDFSTFGVGVHVVSEFRIK